jgi:hypothetical protein
METSEKIGEFFRSYEVSKDLCENSNKFKGKN